MLSRTGPALLTVRPTWSITGPHLADHRFGPVDQRLHLRPHLVHRPEQNQHGAGLQQEGEAGQQHRGRDDDAKGVFRHSGSPRENDSLLR